MEQRHVDKQRERRISRETSKRRKALEERRKQSQLRNKAIKINFYVKNLNAIFVTVVDLNRIIKLNLKLYMSSFICRNGDSEALNYIFNFDEPDKKREERERQNELMKRRERQREATERYQRAHIPHQARRRFTSPVLRSVNF